MLPLLAVLLQASSSPPPPSPSARDEKPVRVWLDPSGPLARGDPVRVYVRTAEDGFLIVVHRGTDGRIRVLFPANPTDDPFVRGGTYEIRSAGAGVAGPAAGGGGGGGGEGAAFVVAEPDGRGLVLAAVSPSSFRFDEFVRVADWNPDALAPSWEGADAVGGVTDIVQRMLGDGYFNYDIATYTVAPRAYAQVPAPGPALQDEAMPSSCIGCTFIGSQVVIIESPLFGFGARRFHRDTLQCDQIATCAGGAASAMALPSRYRVTADGALRRRNDAMVPPRLPVATPTIDPRRRSPVARDLPAAPVPAPVRTIPLGPGRHLAGGSAPRPMNEARRRPLVGVWTPTPSPDPSISARQVRLTMSPIPAPEEAPAPSAAGAALPVNFNTVRRVLAPAAAERGAARQAVGSEIGATSMSRPFVIPQVGVRGTMSGGTGATAFVGGVGGGTQTQAVGFPMAVWRGAAPRGAVIAAGARRH